MKQSIQTKTVSVERIWRQFTSHLPEFLLNIVRNTHVENTLHQGLY